MTPLEQIKKIEGNNVQIFSVNENRFLVFQKEDDDSLTATTTIGEYFFEEEKIKKYYKIIKWYDYGFKSWTSDDNIYSDNSNDDTINTISFEFDINHPLYINLLHLLNYDTKLIIDDDWFETGDLEHYVSIRRKKNKIFVDFIDNTNYKKNLTIPRRFLVFIKNIMPDVRSKMNDKTKVRLADFFKEAFQITNEPRQYTIEEEILKNGTEKDLKMLKKVYKIIPRQKTLK